MTELFGVKYDSSEEKEPKKPLIGRRNFLRGSAGAVALTAIGLGGPSTVDYTQEKIGPRALEEAIKSKTEFLYSAYAVPIDGTLVSSPTANFIRKTVNDLMDVKYQEASLIKMNRALDYITQEFSKYPPFFIRNLRIPSINIVDGFVANGNETTTGSTSRKESGVANFINLEISSGFLNKDKSFGWSEKGPFKKTIHHELFHAIFNVADSSSRYLFSQQWVSLYERVDFRTEMYKGKPGFITEYAQESSTEDFSETASAIMSNSENIWAKVQKDVKLKRKTDCLQQIMFSDTFGLCGEEYWNLLKKGNLPANFFKKRKEHILSLDFNQFQQELKSNNWRNDIISMNGNQRTEEEVFQLFRKKLQEAKI